MNDSGWTVMLRGAGLWMNCAFLLFSVFKVNESLPLQALLAFSRNQYGGSELLFGSSLAFPVFTQRCRVLIPPCC